MSNRKNRDTYRSVRDERQYGLYWYSWLWETLRPLLVGLTVAVIVTGLVLAAWNRVYRDYLGPVDSADETEIPFEIESGQSLTRVANNLEAAGLIHSKSVFKYYCDFAGMGQKIQTGSYQLKKSMTMEQIADRLTTGDGNPLVRNMTLIPGETIESFAVRLQKAGILESTSAFLEKCRSGRDFRDYYYIADVLNSGTAARRKYALEGYLAPNTYEIYTSAGEDEIIRKLLSQTEAAFPADLQEAAKQAGFTMDEILTLASMIEKEAKTGDFAKVSAVFRNRLAKKMPLQSDVTIHYITGIPRMALTETDLQVSSEYNTYTNPGLPPGPICNPSTAAIRAAVYPDDQYVAEGYLYFCACGPESGELHFSRTLEEHERAVAQYRPEWEKYDESRGLR